MKFLSYVAEQAARVTESRRVLLDAAARLADLFSNKDALPRDVQMRIPAGGFVVSQIGDVLVEVVKERDQLREELTIAENARDRLAADRTAALAAARVDGARGMREEVTERAAKERERLLALYHASTDHTEREGLIFRANALLMFGHEIRALDPVTVVGSGS